MADRSVTLCTIAKPTQANLLEWIAYHRLLGFRDIVIYAIGAPAGSDQMLARFASRGIVTYRSWPDAGSASPEAMAIADAVARCRSSWMLYLDAAEYMALRHDNDVETFLNRFGKDVSAVAINWRVFIPAATGDDETTPLIGRHRRATQRNCAVNRMSRALARTADIRRLDTQHVRLSRGRCVDTLGRDVEIDQTGRSGEVEHSFAQINRYGMPDHPGTAQPAPDLADPLRQAGVAAAAHPPADPAKQDAGEMTWETDRAIIHWLPVMREQIALLASVRAHPSA